MKLSGTIKLRGDKSISHRALMIASIIKGQSKIISELEKNEKIDKNLLKYITIKVKKFDLETNYFSNKDKNEEYKYKQK